MATGNIIKVYSRGTRSATSKIGKIKSGKSTIEFIDSDLAKSIKEDLKKGLGEFKLPADQDRYTVMKDWNVEFEPEGKSRIVDGTLRKKR